VLALIVTSKPAGAQQTVSPDFFDLSMTAGEVGAEPWPVDSFSGVRLWDSGVPWSTTNPAPGVYDWRLLNIWMNHAKQNGVDMDYCFGRVPAWISSAPDDHFCANEPGSCDPPRDLNPDGTGTDQAWRDFVTAIVTHSAGRIHYWELWDEFPNAFRWHWPTKGQGTATIQQLLRMAQDARQIIKSIDPTALIVSDSGSLRFTGDYPRWKLWADSGGGSYADIIAFHSYVQPNGIKAPIPETLVGLLKGGTGYPFGKRGFLGFLKSYNLSQPLWDTEGSWAASIAGLTDPDERAGFAVRFNMLNLSLGVQRFYWYEWDNTFVGSLWLWITRWDLALPNASGDVSVIKGFGDGSFQTAISNQAGTNPDAAAVGDFNNDQKLDLVVANQGSNNVTVLPGNGDGTFGTGISSGAGSSPVSVAVGDFNQDGNLDAVVANSTGTVNVLFGKGDGTFQSPVPYNVGSSPSSVAVGDFNNDGYPDIAVTNAGSGTVSVLLNQKNGSFGTPVSYNVGNGPSSVAVGDFNNNGYLDLAVANMTDGTVSVLLNKKNGSFGTSVPYDVHSQPSSVAVGYFAGSTKLSLVVANEGSDDVSLLSGKGDGTFANAVNYAVGSKPVSIAVEDFDGDGFSDIVTSNSGDSTVTTLEYCSAGKSCNGKTFNPATITNLGSSPVALAVGAFDVVGNRDPGTLLKPGIAYQSVYNWTVGNTISTPCNGPFLKINNDTQGVWSCGLTGQNGYQAKLVWYMDGFYKIGCKNNQCTYKTYTPSSQYTQYRTAYGQVVPITKGGKVNIGYIPILLENHSPSHERSELTRHKIRSR
jgi:hypothetical protein